MIAPGTTARRILSLCQRRAGAALSSQDPITCPAVIYATLTEVGKLDDNHQPLRFHYSIAAKARNIDGTGRDTMVDVVPVEFDIGTHYLNHPGELGLIGGSGDWVVELRVAEVERPNPHWHALTSFLPARAQSFTVPPYHSELASFAGAGLTLHSPWGNDPVHLDTKPLGVLPGTTFPVAGLGQSAATLITRWWG